MTAAMESPRILIADDQAHVREALALLLKNEGFVSETVSSPTAVVDAVRDRNFDVLLLDMNYARDTTSGDATTSGGGSPSAGRARPGTRAGEAICYFQSRSVTIS